MTGKQALLVHRVKCCNQAREDHLKAPRRALVKSSGVKDGF